MLKKFIFILLLASQSVFAQIGVEVHLYSQHFSDIKRVDENEKNYGIGLSYRFTENWRALIGVYRNSLTSHEMVCGSSCSWEPTNIDSRYASVERIISAGENYEFGLGFGVADGYKEFIDDTGRVLKKGSDYNPMAGPYLSLGNDISIKLRYMFDVGSFGLQYKF